MTNVLLLRILQQNTSFDGADPLAPVTNIPAGLFRAQTFLFISLAVTLFAAFIAVIGKHWILHYAQVTTRGNIVDRGKGRQAKLARLQKWSFLTVEFLPTLLQIALSLFTVALAIYLQGLDLAGATAVLKIASIGFIFFTIITAGIFPVTSSVPLQRMLPWAREFPAFARFRSRPQATAFLQLGWVKKYSWLKLFLERVLGRFTGRNPAQNQLAEGLQNNDRYMTLSNPAFWRSGPFFSSPIKTDIAASAGFWLLENSTDFSAATAVAAVFSEFQWPSHRNYTTALIRLRDAYAECFRAPCFTNSTRLKALQSAAAYYVLYHTQLIWGAGRGLGVEAFHSDPSGPLPPDLFLHDHNNEWGGDNVFEYLLHTDDRSEPVTSARFLSYLAPYWFCGDSDSAIMSRPGRLQSLNELIQVLEGSQALIPATLTDCVLCVGAAMDFPLHPEDLIRVDKRCVIQPID